VDKITEYLENQIRNYEEMQAQHLEGGSQYYAGRIDAYREVWETIANLEGEKNVQ
jgi:hypothetical protein